MGGECCDSTQQHTTEDLANEAGARSDKLNPKQLSDPLNGTVDDRHRA